jgi:flagellar biosynthesis protein FlhG
VVDTAAGISDNVTVLFGACDIKLLLIQNEPSSIADAYATVKVLQQEFNLSDIMLTPVQVSNERESENIHKRINKVTAQFLGLSLEYSTGIRKDPVVLNSARLGQPAILHAPESDIATDIKRLVDVITKAPTKPANSSDIRISVGAKG